MLLLNIQLWFLAVGGPLLVLTKLGEGRLAPDQLLVLLTAKNSARLALNAC
jgi:hypothetical protein